jgi:hypothetical protein
MRCHQGGNQLKQFSYIALRLLADKLAALRQCADGEDPLAELLKLRVGLLVRMRLPLPNLRVTKKQ